MSSQIYYKFKSNLAFDTLHFDGSVISVRELRNAIRNKCGLKSHDYDLRMQDSNGKIYIKEDELIQKYTSIIICRVPKMNNEFSRKKLLYTEDQSKKDLLKQQSSNAGKLDSGVKNVDLINSNLSEEDKIKIMMQQSTDEYSEKNFLVRPKAYGVPPASYICHKCNTGGHWIHNCPGIRDHKGQVVDLKAVKRPTGIPQDFLIEVDPGTPGAYFTKTGKYMVPIKDAEAYALGKKEKRPFSLEENPPPPSATLSGDTTVSIDNGPENNNPTIQQQMTPSSSDHTPALDEMQEEAELDECDDTTGEDEAGNLPGALTCPVCHSMFRNAVLVGCCGSTYCQACIEEQVRDQAACPNCKASIHDAETTLFENTIIREMAAAWRAGNRDFLPHHSSPVPTVALSPHQFSVSVPSAASVVVSSSLEGEQREEENMSVADHITFPDSRTQISESIGEYTGSSPLDHAASVISVTGDDIQTEMNHSFPSTITSCSNSSPEASNPVTVTGKLFSAKPLNHIEVVNEGGHSTSVSPSAISTMASDIVHVTSNKDPQDRKEVGLILTATISAVPVLDNKFSEHEKLLAKEVTDRDRRKNKEYTKKERAVKGLEDKPSVLQAGVQSSGTSVEGDADNMTISIAEDTSTPVPQEATTTTPEEPDTSSYPIPLVQESSLHHQQHVQQHCGGYNQQQQQPQQLGPPPPTYVPSGATCPTTYSYAYYHQNPAAAYGGAVYGHPGAAPGTTAAQYGMRTMQSYPCSNSGLAPPLAYQPASQPGMLPAGYHGYPTWSHPHHPQHHPAMMAAPGGLQPPLNVFPTSSTAAATAPPPSQPLSGLVRGSAVAMDNTGGVSASSRLSSRGQDRFLSSGGGDSRGKDLDKDTGSHGRRSRYRGGREERDEFSRSPSPGPNSRNCPGDSGRISRYHYQMGLSPPSNSSSQRNRSGKTKQQLSENNNINSGRPSNGHHPRLSSQQRIGYAPSSNNKLRHSGVHGNSLVTLVTAARSSTRSPEVSSSGHPQSSSLAHDDSAIQSPRREDHENCPSGGDPPGPASPLCSSLTGSHHHQAEEEDDQDEEREREGSEGTGVVTATSTSAAGRASDDPLSLGNSKGCSRSGRSQSSWRRDQSHSQQPGSSNDNLGETKEIEKEEDEIVEKEGRVSLVDHPFDPYLYIKYVEYLLRKGNKEVYHLLGDIINFEVDSDSYRLSASAVESTNSNKNITSTTTSTVARMSAVQSVPNTNGEPTEQITKSGESESTHAVDTNRRKLHTTKTATKSNLVTASSSRSSRQRHPGELKAVIGGSGGGKKSMSPTSPLLSDYYNSHGVQSSHYSSTIETSNGRKRPNSGGGGSSEQVGGGSGGKYIRQNYNSVVGSRSASQEVLAGGGECDFDEPAALVGSLSRSHASGSGRASWSSSTGGGGGSVRNRSSWLGGYRRPPSSSTKANTASTSYSNGGYHGSSSNQSWKRPSAFRNHTKSHKIFPKFQDSSRHSYSRSSHKFS